MEHSDNCACCGADMTAVANAMRAVAPVLEDLPFNAALTTLVNLAAMTILMNGGTREQMLDQAQKFGDFIATSIETNLDPRDGIDRGENLKNTLVLN
jgi:hypothetical protein